MIGYVLTAFGTASIGLATAGWHVVLLARVTAWLGRWRANSRAQGAPRGCGHAGDPWPGLWLRANAGHDGFALGVRMNVHGPSSRNWRGSSPKFRTLQDPVVTLADTRITTL